MDWLTQWTRIMITTERTTTSSLKSMLRAASTLITPTVLIIFMAPFITLLFFSLPATDDFCKATLSFGQHPQQQPDVLSVTWLYYTRWSARWLTTLLQSLIMSHVELAAAYGWLLLMIVIANFGALWYFFRTIFRLRPAISL